MIAVSHPTGNEFVRALLRALVKKQLLARFFTTLRAPDKKWLRLLPAALRDQAARREYDVSRSKISTRPVRESVRLVVKTAGFKWLTKHEAAWASLDAVYRDLDGAVARWMRSARERFDAVHCYEDGAEETFRAAAECGTRRIYELPIAYWETVHRILNEEATRLPAWEPTLFATRDSREKLERKTRELDLAEIVVCPSGFVLDSLPERVLRHKKCIVATFGSPAPIAIEARPGGKKLRVLFAGAMTQRKGLADLFAAMKLLDRRDVELVVMGGAILPMTFYREQYPDFIHEPPRPHAAVMELMQTCDVLVLPSLVEGRALVQQEALACGLPLIVTANAGGEDLIEEGRTGFIVPVRSPEKIAEKISWFVKHRELLPGLREEARRKAAGYSWDAYAEEIIRAGGFAA